MVATIHPGWFGYPPTLDRLSVHEQAVIHAYRAKVERGRKLVTLNEREVTVLQLVADGETRDAIAEELGIGPQAVNNLCTAVYKKLDAQNAFDAIRRGVDLGVIEFP